MWLEFLLRRVGGGGAAGGISRNTGQWSVLRRDSRGKINSRCRPRHTSGSTVVSLVLVSRFGLAVTRKAGKPKDLGSIPLRFSFLFKKVVVCGHCLVTLSIISY